MGERGVRGCESLCARKERRGRKGEGKEGGGERGEGDMAP